MNAKKIGELMKPIDASNADLLLATIGMKLGSWNEVADMQGESEWINHAVPSDGKELLNFVHHLCNWMPPGKWKIVQIDNSTSLNSVEAHFIDCLLFGANRVERLGSRKTILFEFGASLEDDRATELLICNLVFALFLFDAHGYLVSSSSTRSERIAIQDGFAYLSTKEGGLDDAKNILAQFHQHPAASPDWIVKMLNDEMI